MGFWSLLRGREEQRVAQETVLNEAQMDTALRAILGGTKVTVKNVLNIPAVSSSVGFIAGTIASLPIRLYRTEGGNSVEVTGDYRLRLLNEETGDLLDAFQWKCTLVRDYLLTGNGYTYVNWAGNRIDGLYYVDPMQVSVEIGADPIYKTARFYHWRGTLLLLAGVQDASQHQGRGRRLRGSGRKPHTAGNDAECPAL